MKRSLFILLLLCLFMGACAPAGTPPAATETRAAVDSEKTLWITLNYFRGQLDTTLEFSVSYYEPAAYRTPIYPPFYFGPDPFLPHVRFRSETGQVVADVPLKPVNVRDMILIDGGIWAEWEALVPGILEYECLELLQQGLDYVTKVELEPGMRLC